MSNRASRGYHDKEGSAREATAIFGENLGEVRDAAIVALTQFRSMAHQPEEVEITFGVRLDAEFRAVIAKTGMAGNFEIKLIWRSNVPGPAAQENQLPRSE